MAHFEKLSLYFCHHLLRTASFGNDKLAQLKVLQLASGANFANGQTVCPNSDKIRHVLRTRVLGPISFQTAGSLHALVCKAWLTARYAGDDVARGDGAYENDGFEICSEIRSHLKMKFSYLLLADVRSVEEDSLRQLTWCENVIMESFTTNVNMIQERFQLASVFNDNVTLNDDSSKHREILSRL